MIVKSPLQKHRLNYKPALPICLEDFSFIQIIEKKNVNFKDPEIKSLFPSIGNRPFIHFINKEKKLANQASPLRVGVVFSGGQAPGGHNVLSGLFDSLKKIHPSSDLVGFLNGPKGLFLNEFLHLTQDVLAPYRNQGGFDLLGSGRAKIETKEEFEKVRQTLKFHQLDGLVIIGGDDSNTNAALLAEDLGSKGDSISIIGVPKTIDGDLKSEHIEISFGFDTASKIYSEMIGNLLTDCLSAKKYYFFVKLMGRSASHLALECALKTQPNLTLISEEVGFRKDKLSDVVKEIVDLICERSSQGKDYGLILIPEGILEFIPECHLMVDEIESYLSSLDQDSVERLNKSEWNEIFSNLKNRLSPPSFDCFNELPKEIQQQFLLERDAHGNIQLSRIETERLFILLVQKELEMQKKLGTYAGKFNPQPLFLGYEGRSGMPSNFDCTYCYALGHASALLIQHKLSGYMACLKNLTRPVEDWMVFGLPIVQLLHKERRKGRFVPVIQKALVDLKSPIFSNFNDSRKKWRLSDSYKSPGPIQFEGPSELTEEVSITLSFEEKSQKFL